MRTLNCRFSYRAYRHLILCMHAVDPKMKTYFLISISFPFEILIIRTLYLIFILIFRFVMQCQCMQSKYERRILKEREREIIHSRKEGRMKGVGKEYMYTCRWKGMHADVGMFSIAYKGPNIRTTIYFVTKMRRYNIGDC